MNKEFLRELMETGYVHSPLPLHEERSLHAEQQKKPVTASRVIWNGGENGPQHQGIGTMTQQGDVLQVVAPTTRGTMPYEDGATLPHFRASVVFTLPGEDWRDYNRLAFRVKPDSDGSHSVHLRVHVKNEGEIAVPDPYWREGQHLANLRNHEWNTVYWEFAALPRDYITELRVTMDADGHDTYTDDVFKFNFADFELQHIDEPEKEHGWDCVSGRIAYSMSGYPVTGRKTAVTSESAKSFRVVNEAGETVLEKETILAEDPRGSFTVLDFSEVTAPGLYRLCCGGAETSPFEIGEKVMESVIWKAINFLFCERCGYPVPNKHGKCHADVIAQHNGLTLSFGGGWHDAGDMSQQMLQTAEVAQEILELADRVTDDPVLRHRLIEEGIWGLEHTLKSRFGDGYRATSVGLGIWSDGLIGNIDDVEWRVHNQAFQNFFCAAVEAQAALFLGDFDRDMAWKCRQAAKEDFRFAKARFEEKGIEHPIMWEHTLNSGFSQYYAAAAWAAASICQGGADEEFQNEAEFWAEKLLACQETGTDGVPMRGFFYRDETHQTIVHYTHQGRDHSFVQALCALCRAFPASPNRAKWENAMALYGEYIKEIYKLATPYGMIPAGIHHISEVDDAETFPILHLLVNYETEKENYREQLESGIPLGNGYFVRMFPVWFSFRGNSAIQLAMGKAASILGRYFGDNELLEIAKEQLYWMSGKNPFCQSLIYGEGERYPQMDANYPGEMVGEMPVGIETRDNEDVPYWPSGNACTYKEVWLTTAGRWLAVMADLYPDM
ncbi:MAG: glycoside hydrolase family 9 protein [Clostridia bacterium]|nr:glycoside hydrolase family 9 protein [Clostridia bacterium]